MKKPALLIIACLGIAAPFHAQGQSAARSSAAPEQGAARPPLAPESSPQLRQKTFEIVWRTIRDRYFDATFGGLDWDKVRERYAGQLAAVKTNGELYALLNKMLGELHVSHVGVVPPEAISKSSRAPGDVGIGLRALDGLAVITNIRPGSAAERAGLRPGFVVKQIDENPVEVQQLDEAIEALSGEPQTRVRLSYLDEQERLREVTLERQVLQADMDYYKGVGFHAEFESKRLAAGIAYIRFSEFTRSLNKKIRAAVLSMSDAPGLIIDLRGNGGGDDEVGIKLAGLLFARRTVLMITRMRQQDDDYYQARPDKHPFPGAVVILQDELSGSASEQFAAGMQEAGRATVIGTKSSGDDLDADLKKLPTGAYLIYPYGQPRTPKGVVIEGRGVLPDIEVKLSRAGLLKGYDAQLDAAVKYIQRTARPQ